MYSLNFAMKSDATLNQILIYVQEIVSVNIKSDIKCS